MGQNDVTFKLGVDATSLEKGLTSVKSQIASLATDKWQQFTAGFGVAALATKIHDVAQEMVALKREAEEQGVGTTFLQSFAKLAEKFGGQAEDANAALTRLNIKIGEAADTSSAAAKSFAKWNITLTDAEGNTKSTEEVMRELMDRYSGLPDASSRAALAMDMFGRSGSHIAAVLALGTEEFDKFTKKAEESGKILNPQQVETYVSAWQDFKSFFSTIGQPFVTLTEKVVRGYQSLGQFAGALVTTRDLWKSLTQAFGEKAAIKPVKVKADTTLAKAAMAALQKEIADELAKIQSGIAAAMQQYRHAANGMAIAGMTFRENEQRGRVMDTPAGSAQRIEAQQKLNQMIESRELMELNFMEQEKRAGLAKLAQLGEEFHRAQPGLEREKIKLEITRTGTEQAKREEEYQKKIADHLKNQNDRKRNMNDLNREAKQLLDHATGNYEKAKAASAASAMEEAGYTYDQLIKGNEFGVANKQVASDIVNAKRARQLELEGRKANADVDPETAFKKFSEAAAIKASLVWLKPSEKPNAELVKNTADALVILNDIRKQQKLPPLVQ